MIYIPTLILQKNNKKLYDIKKSRTYKCISHLVDTFFITKFLKFNFTSL